MLERSGWPARLGGEVVRPEDIQTTCDKGEQGSLIDFALVKMGTTSLYRLRSYPAVHWKTHTGLQLDLVGRCSSWWHRKVVTPPALPMVLKPKKPPDPHSKRSALRAAALARRRERLPEDLRAEFDRMNEPAIPEPTHDAVAFTVASENWPSASTARHDLIPFM